MSPPSPAGKTPTTGGLLAGPVHEQLKDLRLLYLASQLEESFEGLERAFERRIPPGPVRESLRPLFAGGPGHERLKRSLAQLDRFVKEREANLTTQDLLEALLDCERMAQGFYLGRKPDLADPALAELFASLAAEEGVHIQAVQRAIAMTRTAPPG